MRTRRADGIVPVLEAGRLKTQEEPVFQFESEGKKKADAPVQRQSGWKEFCLTQGKGQPFVLFRPSTDWVRTMHIR